MTTRDGDDGGSWFLRPGEPQVVNGKTYPTNEVGGADVFTEEPTIHCERCGEICQAEFTDNGFGPYSVQIGPYHCPDCGWTESRAADRPDDPDQCHCTLTDLVFDEPCWGDVTTTRDGYATEHQSNSWEVRICRGHQHFPDGPYVPEPPKMEDESE